MLDIKIIAMPMSSTARAAYERNYAVQHYGGAVRGRFCSFDPLSPNVLNVWRHGYADGTDEVPGGAIGKSRIRWPYMV